MKIFLSWSGDRSKAMALALKEWLPLVVQAFDPFMSDEDIKKGERGSAVMATELDKCKYGILCITPENRERPWIMFEAGAITKTTDGRASALLLDLEPGKLHAVLGQFQATRLQQDEVFKLVSSLNSGLGDRALPADRLRMIFDKWWPELAAKMEAARQLPAEPAPAVRSVEDITTETLEAVRALARDVADLNTRGLAAAMNARISDRVNMATVLGGSSWNRHAARRYVAEAMTAALTAEQEKLFAEMLESHEQRQKEGGTDNG